MSKTQIPHGWKSVLIPSIITIVDYRGRTPPYSSDGIPHIRSANIKNGKITWSKIKYVDDITYKKYMTRGIPQKGDILMTTEAPMGEVAEVPEKKISLAQRIMLLRPSPELVPKFLIYQLMSPIFQQKLQRSESGSVVKGIASKHFKKLSLIIPPLETQKKIVQKLDHILVQLEEKKRSILELQAKNENAIEMLHDQISGEIITKYYSSQKVLSNSKILKLSDVCIINPSKEEISKLNDKLEVSFVPMRAVDDIEGKIKTSEIRFLGEVKKGYTYFKENDVIFAKITPCMENGKSALGTNLRNKIGFGSTEFHVLRAKESVLPEWIYYFVRQNKFRKDAEAIMTGSAGQQRVPKSFIESYSIPIPSIPIQKEVIEKIKNSTDLINSLKSKIMILFDNLEKNSKYLSNLQNTILDKAFSGKLVN